MRPEGFRQVLTDRGTEGALLVLADALEALSRRMNAQDAVEDKLRGEARADAETPAPPAAPAPAPAPALEAGKSEGSNG